MSICNPYNNYYEQIINNNYVVLNDVDSYSSIEQNNNECFSVLEEIILEESKKQFEELQSSLSFTFYREREIKINLEKKIKSILFSYAKRNLYKIDKHSGLIVVDELPNEIIGDICIEFKITFSKYLKYASLIKKCFYTYIDENYLFDKWGYYCLTNDKEFICLSYKNDYVEKLIESREKYVENSNESLIEELDF